MLRKNPYLTRLDVRKKLLLAESEVNRAELLKELGAMKGEISRIKKNVQTIGSLASTAALLATTVSVLHKYFGASDNSNGASKEHSKISWIAAALNGARLGTSLFQKIKSFLRQD